jgi:hypothetical protein
LSFLTTIMAGDKVVSGWLRRYGDRDNTRGFGGTDKRAQMRRNIRMIEKSVYKPRNGRTDLRYATPSPATCPAWLWSKPFFLNTKLEPMRTPLQMARMTPTV